jgi:hypothetical protein
MTILSSDINLFGIWEQVILHLEVTNDYLSTKQIQTFSNLCSTPGAVVAMIVW